MGRMQQMQDVQGPCPNTKLLSGAFTIGASGAISAQQGMALTGATFAKNAATGRYDITVHRGFKRILGGAAWVVHPAVGTAGTLADGNQLYLQGVTAAMFALPPTALPETGPAFQAVRTDTQAVANPTNGVTISWTLLVSDS